MRALSGILLLLIAGCAPPWAIVVQSGPPSAAAGAPQITYAADFQQLVLDGQPAGNLIGGESANEQANIQQALQEMDAEFFQNFAGRLDVPVTPAAAPPAQGEVRLTGIYAYVQRGARGPIGAATVVTMRYQVSLGGQVVDEVEMTRQLKPSLTRSSIARRMKWCGGQLGSYAAKFFNQLNSGQ